MEYSHPMLAQDRVADQKEHVEVHTSVPTPASTEAAKAEEATKHSESLGRVQAAPKPAPPGVKKAPPKAKAVVQAHSELDYCPKDKAFWKAIPGLKSTSGVSCEESCKEAFNRVRRDRTGIRYAIFDFDSKLSWIYPSREGVQTDDYEADWASFVADLPEGGACYAVYNFTYMDSGGSGYSQGGDVEKNKTILFNWSDNTCKVKLRMVSASSAAAIKQVCKGTLDQPVHYKEEMEYNNMCDRMNC